MVAEYLSHGLSQAPVRFAETYYVHYPKVAIGHWPFVFHSLLAIWMSVLGKSRISALLFQAVCSGVMSAVAFRLLRQNLSPAVSFLLSILLTLTPLALNQSSCVMTEVLGATFIWLATLTLMENFKTRSARSAIFFGLFAALAVMTRPSGWLVFLLLPLASLFSRSIARALNKPLLVSAALAAAICAPFYIINYQAMKDGTAEMGPLSFVVAAMKTHPLGLFWGLGPILGIFALVGAVLQFLRIPFEDDDKVTPTVLALLSAVAIFTVSVPSSLEPRHLFPALLPSVYFAGLGLEWMLNKLRRGLGLRLTFRGALHACALALLIGQFATVPSRPLHSVFKRAVHSLISDPTLNSAKVVLVSSSGESGEGRMIAEVVAQQPACCPFVLERATQQLAQANWNGTVYSLRYRTPKALGEGLEANSIGLIALHDVQNRVPFAHHNLLREYILANSLDWRLIGSFKSGSSDDAEEEVRFYRNDRIASRTPHTVTIDMSGKLGRMVTLTLDPSAP